jgi:hypothetical protein
MASAGDSSRYNVGDSFFVVPNLYFATEGSWKLCFDTGCRVAKLSFGDDCVPKCNL